MKNRILLLLAFCIIHISTRAQLGVIGTEAGIGVAGHTGDGGLASLAQISFPHGITRSVVSGKIYFSENGTNCHYIRMIDPSTGLISTVAGIGTHGYSGDGGLATAAGLNHPFDMVIDVNENIYFTDEKNNRVRMIDNATGIISTIAGTGVAANGADGTATSSDVNNPSGIAMDAAGNLFISERHRVRKIDLSTGLISTIGGSASVSYTGDGGPVSAAGFSFNNFLNFDNYGNLLVTDNGNHCIRKIDAVGGVITPSCIINTIVGTGIAGAGGDGGVATSAELFFPGTALVNATDYMFVLDNENNKVRGVDPSTNIINTVGATGVPGYSGDGGPAVLAQFNTPRDMAIDNQGNYYITDAQNHRVRSIFKGPKPYFVCEGSCIPLACTPGVSYSWLPVTDLSDPLVQNPVACPSATTEYTVTITDASGGTTIETVMVVVNPLPAAITGAGSTPCAGSAVALSSSTPGGNWYSADLSIAVVDGVTGIVTGMSGGTALISYMLPTGCLTTTNVTFSGVIEGNNSVCQGSTIALSGTPSGGTWSSSNTAIATVSASGVVGGVVTGSALPATVTITYAAAGCTQSVVVTVGAPFSAPTVAALVPFPSPGQTDFTYCSSAGGIELEAGGIPGAVYIWSTATVTTVGDFFFPTYVPGSTPVVNTYTVTARLNGCSAKTTGRIVVPALGCSPCDYFYVPTAAGCSSCGAIKPFITRLSTTVSSALPAGNYYFAANSNYTFSGSYTMTDVVTYHNSGRGIIIAPTARLTFNHCHFASKCSWRGILIDHTLSSFGELILNGGTLVEGTGTLGFGGVTVAAGTVAAPNAYVPSGYVVSSGGHSILQSTDAIFNSNLTGILLSYWPASSSAPAIMPFRVYNTVFTEANFTPFYSGAASTIDDHYPMSWPTVSSLKTIASLPGSADYNFNPYYGIDDYTASTSVVNNRVGITLSGGFTDPTTGVYKSFVTGDKTTASNFNLFSNLRTGIYVGTGSGTLNSGANAIVYNSVFKLKYNGTINPIGPSFPDAGIKVMNKIQGYNFLLGVGDDGSSTETGTSLGNKFYNMSIGVRALVDGNSPYGYHTIVVRNSLMTSKNTTASFVDNLAVTAHSQIFDKIDIKDNIIQNVSKGVEVFLKALSGTYNWGAVNVDNNNLGVSNTGYVSGTSGFMNNAITAADVPGAGVTGYTDIGSVKINSNVIRDVYNGISVSDFVRKPIQISHNEITLKATPSQTIQRGIFVDECASSLSGGSRDNNEVADNKVTGPGWQVPAGEGTYFAINNVFSGIYFLKSGSSGHLFDVSCNYTYELRQGFHFVWNNYISWKRNVMENTKVGLLLAGNASFPYPPTIGDQGAACDPSDNLWIEHPGVFDWSTTTGCYQTYLNSVNPATSTPTSKLYVRNSPGYLPTVNGSQSIWGTSTLKYTFGTSLIDASTGCSLSDATRCDPAGGGPKAGGSSVITAAAKISYTLSPNPSQGSFSISQSEAVDGIVKVKVFNAVGTEVYGNNLQFTSGSAQVNINDVVSGIYLVEVIDGAGARSVYRIMIQK